MSTATLEIVHADERVLWEAVAAGVAPRRLVRPSTWAEDNVVLSQEMSPTRPGPFRCSWKPYTKALHDVLHDEPAKRGLVLMKRAQIGATRAVMNLLGCWCETQPGPFLFLISDQRQAAFFASEQFDPMVKGVPALRELFKGGADERRESVLERPYKGGRVDFAGAGSVASVTSRTYTVVAIDEYDLFQQQFRSAAAGDGFQLAEARTQAAPHLAKVLVWSHPRRQGEGVHGLYERISDRRRWVFDCPHCAATVAPHSSMIHMGAVDENGDPDPSSAVLRCPHCGQVITDAERARAVWPPEAGGSGRLESDLEPEEARKRHYVGLAINGLADPTVRVTDLAAGKVRARSEAELMAWHNVVMGEPYTPATAVVSADLVAQAIRKVDRVVLPAGPEGAHLLGIGVDVQAPEHNPTLYVHTRAWTATGHAFGVDYVKLTGWAALTEYVRQLAVPIGNAKGEIEAHLVPMVVGIDCGAFTGQVLDWCRLQVVSAVGNNHVKLLPLRFVAHVKSTSPALKPDAKKLLDPARPWLGPLERYDLHRHSWVDREMRRWIEGRISVLGVPPSDLAQHITANVLEPVADTHGWGNPDLEWNKQKGRRDDWAMAGTYAETAAVLAMQLDRLHEMLAAPAPKQDDDQRRSGWLSKGRRSGNWWR